MMVKDLRNRVQITGKRIQIFVFSLYVMTYHVLR